MKTKIDLKSFTAAIFDMDGTMVDNATYHKQAWILFLKRHKVNFELTGENYHQNFSGRKNDHILKMLFGGNLSSEEIKKFAQEKEEIYRSLYAPFVESISGLKDVVEDLKREGKILAVATTANKANREFVLRSLGLQEYFPVTFGDEDVEKGKPDPEIYLKTAKELGLDSDKCLVFEDSPSGVRAAKDAGMRVVGVTTNHTKEELNLADYQIKDYEELKFEQNDLKI